MSHVCFESFEASELNADLFQIRPMTEADILQAAQIEAEIFSNPWKKGDFLDSLRLNYTCYYAASKSQEELLGYCGFYQSGDLAEITNVAVKSSARKNHIAQSMLQKLMEEGLKRGVCQFTLEVRAGNLPAIHLYEKLGFRKEGIRKNFYRNPIEDAFVMNKIIK